jgi:LemA protein
MRPALKSTLKSTLLRATFLTVLLSLLSGCGYNQIQQKDEATKAAWSEVLNQYKRRADLIPNLVNTVKGYAAQEREVLIRVTEARAKVGQIQVNADDAESLAKFQAAQGELSGALSRLMVVTENYPNLKSDQSFRDLQGAAGRDGESHHRRARSLHHDGAGLQRLHPLVPAEPDGHDVRRQAEAELHGRKRARDFRSAERRLRRRESVAAAADGRPAARTQRPGRPDGTHRAGSGFHAAPAY